MRLNLGYLVYISSIDDITDPTRKCKIIRWQKNTSYDLISCKMVGILLCQMCGLRTTHMSGSTTGLLYVQTETNDEEFVKSTSDILNKALCKHLTVSLAQVGSLMTWSQMDRLTVHQR